MTTQSGVTSDAARATTAVLLVNLGTPAAPTRLAVRRFLAEFLSDPRVIETPRWLWLPILQVILLIRPSRSARAYASIWSNEGSPLLVNSRKLLQQLQRRFDSTRTKFALAMRYGAPSVPEVISELARDGVRRVLVLPMYPQYSAPSTGSVFDAVSRVLQRQRWPLEVRFISDYFADPLYIEALALSVEAYWSEHGRAQCLLLSLHGLPQSFVDAGDPYLAQCQATATLLRERLKLTEAQFELSFQSRVGRQRWLQPYTESVLDAWPAQGVRNIQVLCPGFAVDCLETLEEIAIRDSERFIEAGGESLAYIPALNDSATHVDLFEALARRHLQGWETTSPAERAST